MGCVSGRAGSVLVREGDEGGAVGGVGEEVGVLGAGVMWECWHDDGLVCIGLLEESGTRGIVVVFFSCRCRDRY